MSSSPGQRPFRVAVAEFAQETDSFTPLRTTLEDFESYGLYFGQELLDRMKGAGPIGGLIEFTDEQPGQWELVPLLRAWAGAGGEWTDDTYEWLRVRLLERLRSAGKLDAVFLALHGAAASESEDDLEGAILADMRAIVGPDVPIIAPLDHHANITQRMFANADLLVGHETQPHDPPHTGRKAAMLLGKILRKEIRPVRAWRKIPLITPQDQFLTSTGPMKVWFDRAREFERQEGVLDVSPYPMQPWLDVAEGGWSVVVHTNDDPARGEQLAERLAQAMADLALELREQFFRSDRLSISDAVFKAIHAPSGLVLLSDTGDSVYGGSTGDNTCLLRELLVQNPKCLALVPVVDAEAVDAAQRAGVAATMSLDVGGRHDREFCQPVRLQGRVSAISAGVVIEIPGRGVCHIGRTAMIESGGVRVVLLDQRSFAINHPILYQHLGVDPASAQVVVLKTASNFQFFAAWRKELIRVDTPGTTQSNLQAFAWRRIPRPIYGLDPTC